MDERTGPCKQVPVDVLLTSGKKPQEMELDTIEKYREGRDVYVVV